MNSFELKTVYLDTLYKDTFERYLIRKKLITKTMLDTNEERSNDLEPLKLPLAGLKKLLVLLTLFENVDSDSSIYDFSRLIDLISSIQVGIILRVRKRDLHFVLLKIDQSN